MSNFLCVGGIGLPGSGKSLDQIENYLLPRLLDGEHVYSTTWLNWNKSNAHYIDPSNKQAIADTLLLKNSTIHFDEIGQVFPPRSWKDENSDLWRFFQLHRKRHNDIIFNTQHLSLVAKTAETVVSDWFFYQKSEPDWFHSDAKYINIDLQSLTLAQLNQLSRGFELGIWDIDEIADNTESLHYSISNLCHYELDEFKKELQHWHCPMCDARHDIRLAIPALEDLCLQKKTGYYIPLKDEPMCPKHPWQRLYVVDTSMYDSDYDPYLLQV